MLTILLLSNKLADNAPKFMRMENELRRRGFQLKNSSQHSPQPNGLSERMNRTLLYKVKSLLNELGLSHKYYSEQLLQYADLYTRKSLNNVHMSTLHQRLLNKTPNAKHQTPNNSNIPVFGCTAYAHLYKPFEIRNLVVIVTFSSTWKSAMDYSENFFTTWRE